MEKIVFASPGMTGGIYEKGMMMTIRLRSVFTLLMVPGMLFAGGTGLTSEKLEKNPQVEMIPLDPSDGGGWGHSAEEEALGPISSRVVLLANEVAQAINEKVAADHGRKYVGIYAYNEHAMPPTIPVHSNVVVLVATAFNKSGLTLDQLIDGWQKQGAMIGIRDYYNVIT
jgi:hypothetical protein